MNKLIYISLLLLYFGNTAISQNDFTVEWNSYEAGDTIEESPFNGGFTIKNIGETTIATNDTIWYGYLIDGIPYDINLNIDMFSGTVLSEDLEPGEELSIFNWIYWALWESGAEIEVCAVVYGAGYEAYTGGYYTGDDDSSNNKSCLTAIVVESVSISEQIEKLEISFFDDIVRISNFSSTYFDDISIQIYGLDGREVLNRKTILKTGINYIQLDQLSSGIYVIRVQGVGVLSKKKILIL